MKTLVSDMSFACLKTIFVSLWCVPFSLFVMLAFPPVFVFAFIVADDFEDALDTVRDCFGETVWLSGMGPLINAWENVVRDLEELKRGN